MHHGLSIMGLVALAYLCPNLVSALANLNMKNFSHFPEDFLKSGGLVGVSGCG